MKRGDVYWFTFKAPDKRRPVLILTRNAAIPYLNAVTVVPITSTIRTINSEIYLEENDGLPNPCVANFDNIITVPKGQLSQHLTVLDFEKMLEADQALKFALGCIL